jgi:hypothetical protein
VKLQSTGHDKIPAEGWLLLWYAGGMFTTRWTRGLLLVGSMKRQRLNSYTQTENIKQLSIGCSECTFAVFCRCCDNILN